MRKFLFAAAGFAALAGAAGLAMAQDGAPRGHHGGGLFQSDANNDGVLTRQEFDAGRAAHFAQADANSDGQLARDEMRGGMRGHHGRRGGHGGSGGHDMMGGADANNDGNITREEFLARPLEHFNRMDADSNGVITQAERDQAREQMRARFAERRAERGERSEGRQRMNPDTNGDHQISRAEFDAAGAAMFDRLDANNDGRVTREEVQAAHPRRGGAQNQ